MRVITTFKSIRILCFFDDGNLVVLTNCFVKKTQKNTGKGNQTCRETKKKYLKEANSKKLEGEYDADSLAFRLGVMLKEARKEANLTQEELAERTGTKKSYISRIERGLSDIQVSTYYKLIELGLGKHLNIEIA